MSVNTKEFMAAFDGYIETVEGSYSQTLRATSLDMFSRYVKRSPVGNPDNWESPPPDGYSGGRFRANWQIGVNEEPSREIDAIDDDGDPTIDRETKNLEKFTGDGYISFVQNLPYWYRLEYLGWSSQAPKGMVRITLSEFEQILKKAAQDNKV